MTYKQDVGRAGFGLMRVHKTAFLIAGVALGLAIRPGHAATLVAGSAWGVAPLVEETAGEGLLGGEASAGDGGFSLRFTPRQGPGSSLDGGLAAMIPALRLSVGVDEGLGAPARGLDLGHGGDPASPIGAGSGSLMVGGALEWDDWSVGGDLRRLDAEGIPTNLLGGSLGYGPMRFRLSYGEVEREAEPNASLWLFSTDLATSSWLSLEGDLAVRSSPVEEPSTVGRVGIRLRF